MLVVGLDSAWTQNHTGAIVAARDSDYASDDIGGPQQADYSEASDIKQRGWKIVKTIIVVVGCVILCASAYSQEQPRILRGGGHLLGETAEEFFSEALAGEMQQACERKDWKTVKQLANNGSRAKDVCASEKLVKQQATSGWSLWKANETAEDFSRRKSTYSGCTTC